MAARVLAAAAALLAAASVHAQQAFLQTSILVLRGSGNATAPADNVAVNLFVDEVAVRVCL